MGRILEPEVNILQKKKNSQTRSFDILCTRNTSILLLIILGRLVCPKGMLIVGRWCPTLCTEDYETLDPVLIVYV